MSLLMLGTRDTVAGDIVAGSVAKVVGWFPGFHRNPTKVDCALQ